jgi:hypothetical protein
MVCGLWLFWQLKVYYRLGALLTSKVSSISYAIYKPQTINYKP